MNISANFATGPVIGQKFTQWVINQAMIGNYVPLGITLGVAAALIIGTIAYAIYDNKKNPTA